MYRPLRAKAYIWTKTKKYQFVSQPSRPCVVGLRLQIEGPSDRHISWTGKKCRLIWNHNFSVFAGFKNMNTEHLNISMTVE